ncbi:MAG: SpoIIE family protein phosphatase [Bacteroidales bacterium]|nr:SpoIIE family protein phosphatase [Bacteroidales bacterium]
MKLRILSFVKRSLATRMSLVTVFFAAIILIAALGYMFNVSRQAIRKEAVNRATNQLENTVLRVINILDQVEVAANNTAWLINRHLDSPELMFEYSRRILENNPDLNGCSIAFEPNFFPGRGRYFSAYSYNNNGVIETTQEGNEHYEYFYLDWYQLCKLLDRPVWTEPFMDYNPENIYSQDMIASYCQPLKDREGKYIGTLSVDLSLSWLSNTISAVKPYPNSYSIMIGQGGTYFVHPDSTKLVYQTIFTESMEHPDTAMVNLGHAMQRGEEGMRQLKVNGEDCYVFYKPLSTTGWSVAIVCPESDIFGGFNKLRRSVTGTVIGGLLLLMLVCGRFIRHEIKPLTKLARQAETIASGDFSVTLPEEGRTDEIGQLSESFTNMQHSLVNYIEELKTTTAQKASIENELQVASDIQMSMVPRMFPAFPNRNDIDLYASMTPAKEVGGDLYDFFIQDEILHFCVGDVSGKGIPASLFMAVTRNLFRIVAQQGLPPAEIASHINNILAVDNDRGMFVTMFIGKADLRTGHLDYCNCGHNAPVIDGQFLKMQYDNQPLGLWEDDPFYGESIDNFRGRQFLLYTDGLNEAENAEKELLGNDRMIELMQDAQDMDARHVVDMLKAAVEEHRAGADPNDDLTLLCLTIRS